MKQKILYILSALILVYLGLIAYSGLSSLTTLPSIDFIDNIAGIWFSFFALMGKSFWVFLPLLFLWFVPQIVFCKKNAGLLLFIINTMIIILIIVEMFFPSVFGA